MAQPTPWRFHPERDGLLAEAHARPSTPALAPMLASRIATLSGEGGVETDRAHMVKLCRKLGAAEPGPRARSCFVEAGSWSLRWERRTEVSTWTVLSPSLEVDGPLFGVTALENLPQTWLAKLPGEVLAAVHATLLAETPATLPFLEEEVVAAKLEDDAAQVFTDFRPGPDGFTRLVVVQNSGGAALAGRILHELFEIETYRLLALLAFPLAGATATQLSRLEADAADAARTVLEDGDIDADRALLARLAALAGEAEAMAATTSFRFSAATAYHGLVRERIAQLNERPLGAGPTLGEFMERRLAPAMRTCGAVAQRQRDVIERLARTTQMLSTRVDVASEVTNVGLLASMDRRSKMQLRLQQTVEGLSVVAIAYYALGLIAIGFKGASQIWPSLNPELATGVVAPLVVLVIWRLLRRAYRRLSGSDPV